MQMKALRSANLAKLSSSNSTSDEYWLISISAGTPAGYCLSQIRSMVLPSGLFAVLPGWDALFCAVLSNAAAEGKRLRAIDALSGWNGRLEPPERRSNRAVRRRFSARKASLRCSWERALPRLWVWPAWLRACRMQPSAFWRLWEQLPAWPAWHGPAGRRPAWRAWHQASLPIWRQPLARRVALPRPAASFREAVRSASARPPR